MSILSQSHRFAAVARPLIIPAIHRCLSTQVVESTSLFRRLYDRYSIRGQQKRIDMGERLFRAASIRANDPIWFGPGRISRDFRPRHALLTLHVWFLHKRLINSTEQNKHFALLVQEELFDILWHDTRLRIRAEGVNELSVEKHVKDVQQYTFQQLCHLDHAYTEEFLMDEKKRLEEVAFLVWHHMLGREEDVTDDQLQRLVLYIDLQLQNVLWQLPEKYWQEGRIGWINIPDFDNMRDNKGNLLPKIECAPEDILPKFWERSMNLAGRVYYYNTKTMASQWEKPVSS